MYRPIHTSLSISSITDSGDSWEVPCGIPRLDHNQ